MSTNISGLKVIPTKWKLGSKPCICRGYSTSYCVEPSPSLKVYLLGGLVPVAGSITRGSSAWTTVFVVGRIVALHKISTAGLHSVRRSGMGCEEGSDTPFWYPR